MSKQTDKKADVKENGNWLNNYCKDEKVKKSCASYITNEMRIGKKIAELIAEAKKFNSKQGKGAKCLQTEGSVKSHFRWLHTKGCVVSCKGDVYRVTYPHADKKVA